MVIRGLVGLLIGAAYGLVVTGVVFLLTRIGLDYEHPGPLIPNTVEFAWFITVMAGIIAGVCGAVVGFIVGLLGVDKTKAAKGGFISGALLFLPMFLSTSVPTSLSNWISLLVTLAVLPFGMALVGIVVAIVAARLKPFDL
jgi:hypothetical protein